MPPRSSIHQRFAPARVITDDAGIERRVDTEELESRADARSRYAIESAESLVAAPVTIGSVFLVYLLVVLPAIALALLIGMTLGFGAMRWLAYVVFAGCFVTVIFLTRTRNKRRVRDRMGEYTGILLANGLCPVCAYEVTGLPPQPDGNIICTECGSAWKHDRVARERITLQQVPEAAQLQRQVLGGNQYWNQRLVKDADNRERRLLDANFPARHRDRRQRRSSQSPHRRAA